MQQDDTVSREQAELLARIVACSYDAIFSVNEGVITTWNKGAERLYGYTAQEAVGEAFFALLWPSAFDRNEAPLHERFSENKSVISIKTDHVRKDGQQIAIHMNLSLLTDASGASLGTVVTVRGISKEARQQEFWNELGEIQAITHQAVSHRQERVSLGYPLEQLVSIDSRTGLTNRPTLEMNLDNECRRSARYSAPLSFLMLYIDNLRHYRETRGIPTGEAILKQVATLLQEEARTTDLVACYEAELLCIVLPHTDRAGSMVAAERIRERIAAFYSPEQRVTISVGAATFSHTMESGKALIAEAEYALSVAKQRGSNRAVHFNATKEYAVSPHDEAAVKTSEVNSAELPVQAVVSVGETPAANTAHKDITHTHELAIERWAAMLGLRDKETEGHSRRVMELTVSLAQLMGVGGQELVYIRWGALLHDIGKIGIPDSILFKPGPLTSEEWGVMHSHPTWANEVLGTIPFLHPALDIPFSHHEHWDGTGYPLGLQNEEIPLAARIFAIVDVWDALRSDRPYRNAWSERAALDHIYSQSGKQFDPKVARAFHQMMLTNNIESRSEADLLAV